MLPNAPRAWNLSSLYRPSSSSPRASSRSSLAEEAALAARARSASEGDDDDDDEAPPLSTPSPSRLLCVASAILPASSATVAADPSSGRSVPLLRYHVSRYSRLYRRPWSNGNCCQ